MITLTSEARFDDMEQIVARLNRPTTSEQRRVTAALRTEYTYAFARQGSSAGPWPRLAPATIADRARHGYGPTPMLVRSGGYRATFTQLTGDHVERVDPDANGVTYTVGSADERADWLNRRRPVDDLDESQEERLWAAIDAVVEQLRI